MKNILILGSNTSAIEEIVRNIEVEMRIQISECKVFNYNFMDKYFYDKKKIILALILNFFAIPIFLLKKREKSECILLQGMLCAIPFLFWIKIFPINKSIERIVLIRFFIHAFGEKGIIKRILRYILNNKKLIINVQSRQEEVYYGALTRSAKLQFFPYCQDEVRFSDNFGKGKAYVFAGGYTNRDYGSLLKAAENIQYDFIIICSRLNQITKNLSKNVTVLQDVPKEEFNGYLKNAKIVVIPLKEETGASGQMVALSAMSLKRPVIYSDVSSIALYFTNGKTGIAYETGNKKDLERKIAMLLNDADKTRKIAENGYKAYRTRYRNSRYYEFIQRLMLNKKLISGGSYESEK